MIWFEGNILRHSFCVWLAIRDRFGTRDWLCNTALSPLCLLCVGGVESHDHLSFSVPLGLRCGLGF